MTNHGNFYPSLTGMGCAIGSMAVPDGVVSFAGKILVAAITGLVAGALHKLGMIVVEYVRVRFFVKRIVEK